MRCRDAESDNPSSHVRLDCGRSIHSWLDLVLRHSRVGLVLKQIERISTEGVLHVAIPHDRSHDFRHRFLFCASETRSQINVRPLLLEKGGQRAPFKKQSRGTSTTPETANTNVRTITLHFGVNYFFGGCWKSVQLESWHIGPRHSGHCLRDQLSAISKDMINGPHARPVRPG